MYCPNCGSNMNTGMKFCEECGARIYRDSGSEYPPQTNQYMQYSGASGFSNMIDSELVVAALRKTKRVTRIVGIVFVLLPILGFTIYGAISDKNGYRQSLCVRRPCFHCVRSNHWYQCYPQGTRKALCWNGDRQAKVHQPC